MFYSSHLTLPQFSVRWYDHHCNTPRSLESDIHTPNLKTKSQVPSDAAIGFPQRNSVFQVLPDCCLALGCCTAYPQSQISPFSPPSLRASYRTERALRQHLQNLQNKHRSDTWNSRLDVSADLPSLSVTNSRRRSDAAVFMPSAIASLKGLVQALPRAWKSTCMNDRLLGSSKDKHQHRQYDTQEAVLGTLEWHPK